MKVISKSTKDTLKVGRVIAGNLGKGDIVCLFGELGSGKTVLTKGIACGLGINSDKVVSPSFVLIRQYSRARIPLYHFDLYRLKDTQDILALGYEEYFYNDAVTVIEWADKLKCLTPAEFLKVEMSVTGENSRLLKFSAFGIRYAELIKKIKDTFSK